MDVHWALRVPWPHPDEMKSPRCESSVGGPTSPNTPRVGRLPRIYGGISVDKMSWACLGHAPLKAYGGQFTLPCSQFRTELYRGWKTYLKSHTAELNFSTLLLLILYFWLQLNKQFKLLQDQRRIQRKASSCSNRFTRPKADMNKYWRFLHM